MTTTPKAVARCKTCQHEDADMIDTLLSAGMSTYEVAEKYGLTNSAVERHRRNHLDQRTSAKLPVPSDAEHWEGQLKALYDTAVEFLRDAKVAGPSRLSLACIKEARATIELIAKLLGFIGDGGTKIAVGIQIKSGGIEGNELRQALFRALDPFPEARAAVARELLAIGAMGDDDHD